MILDLLKKDKNNRGFLDILRSLSLHVNILDDCSTIIKTS